MEIIVIIIKHFLIEPELTYLSAYPNITDLHLLYKGNIPKLLMVCREIRKIMLSGVFFQAENASKPFSAGAPPRPR